MKLLSLLVLIATLTACAMSPHTYRGVPEVTWHKLSPEQRNLIVDQSFNKQFGTQVAASDQVKLTTSKRKKRVKHG